MAKRRPPSVSVAPALAGALAPSHRWLPGEGAAWLARQIERERDARTGFLFLPVFFALGVLLYFSATTEPTPWAGALLCLVSGFAAGALPGRARLPFLALAFIAAGFAAATWRTALVAAPVLERAGLYRVTGFIEAVDATPFRHRLTLRVTSMPGVRREAMPFRLRIGAPGAAQFAAGDSVSLGARLAPPSEPAMPGGYDFRRESFFRAVGGVGYAVGRIEPHPAEAAPDFSLRLNAAVDRARNALTTRIATSIGGEAGALAAALVTGKRGLISNETNDDLRGSGLYHIVSISGLHMVMAAGVMFWSLRAFLALFPAIALRYPIKKWSAGGAMLGATAYCIFSGSEVATERSLIMTLVMLGAILVDRPALALRNVAISALIVLAREPESLLGPSFQMSFAAVAALIAGHNLWRRFQPEQEPREKPRGFVRPGVLARSLRLLLLAFGGIVATTVLASLATAPFSAYHFHRLNPYGLIGNALAIPLVSLIVMPCAVIGTLLVPFGLDGLVWSLMGEGMRGVLFVAAKVAGIEGAAPPVARAPAYLFGLLVIALLVLVIFQSALRWAAIPILVLWALLLRAAPLPDLMIAPDGRMALFRSENGQYALLAPETPAIFTLQQWLPALGDPRLPADPSLRQGTRCDRNGCTGRTLGGERIALSLTAEAARLDCRRASLVITPARLPPAACASGTTLIAEENLRIHGAQRIDLQGAKIQNIETSLDPTRPRPWRRLNILRRDATPGTDRSQGVARSAPQRAATSAQSNNGPALPDPDASHEGVE